MKKILFYIEERKKKIKHGVDIRFKNPGKNGKIKKVSEKMKNRRKNEMIPKTVYKRRQEYRQETAS